MLVHKRSWILLFTLLVPLLLSACMVQPVQPEATAPEAAEPEVSTEEANIALVEEFQLGVYRDGNLNLVDELTTDDFAYDEHEPGEASREAFRQDAIQATEQLGPVNVELHDIFAEGDLVVGRWSVSGAGDQEFTLKGITINRVEDGKIAREWTVADELGLLIQLGVIPPMGESMPVTAPAGSTETAAAELDEAQIEANRQTATRITEEMWGEGNADLIDEFYADDFVWHDPDLGATPDKAGLASSLAMFHSALSVSDVSVEHMVTAGDKIATHYRVNAVHSGEGLGIPATNRDVEISGISIARFNEEGQVVEEWGVVDMLGLMGQIGMVPPMALSVPGDYDTVTFTAQEYAFTGPESISAGWSRLELQNVGMELHHMQLLRLGEGHTMADLMTALQENPAHPPEWLSFTGGPAVIIPGESTGVLVNLEAGEYVLICFLPDAEGVPHAAHGMVRPLTVTEDGDAAAALPEADITMELHDFSFTLSDEVTPGPHTFRVVNSGEQPHEVALIWLAPGVGAMDFVAAIEAGIDPNSPPPGKPIGGLQVIDPGDEGYFTADFLPGEYALICFHPDEETGAPHFALGMVRQFRVE